ncbi:MAG: rod-binding protein [Proteobacteria bacterium]|nr:rod-binding protein [Pseudomonadota bacterium]
MNGMSENLFSMQAANALAAGRSLPNVRRVETLREGKKVAEEFEAVFLGQMLQPMFQNIEAAEPFGGSPSEKMWRTMQVEEYGKAIAKAGGIGIADAVFREILKAQELR